MKKTDLAVESAQLAAGLPGVRSVSRNIGGVKITDIRIPQEVNAARPAGRYITLEGDPAGSALPALLKRAIEQLLPPDGLILAAGLGNPARTGIETVRMVRAIACELSAGCILAVDSLCCRDPLRLCRTVQLSTAGITPGSGVEASRKELSAKTAGLPVIACGVPTASLLSSITRDKRHDSFLAAPVDEDIQAQLWAECISSAVNSIIAH